MAGNTIVEYFAEHERYRCGYCGSSDTNYSHGMWAHAMTVQDYQDLLNRGWRRSGKYVYKPTMNQTCCPQYTIRCEALNFKLSKSQKKALKKVNKYLIDGIKPSCDKDEPEFAEVNENQSATKCENIGTQSVVTLSNDERKTENQSDEMKTENQSDDMKTENQSDDKTVDPVPGDKHPKESGNQSKPSENSCKTQTKATRTGDGADPSKPPCKKAKDLRREKKLAKLAAKGIEPLDAPKPGPSAKPKAAKTLEDYLNEPHKASKCAHKLEIRLVRSGPRSDEFEASLEETHSVYHKYQTSIHKDEPEKPNMRQFTRFLVDSPLEAKHPNGTLPMGYGSFHQQYILDGKIICVGVIDILPSFVSSKYLYYDPDYSFLSLGTYSALQEMAFVRELHTFSPELLYYYMGFYIHSCPKMKYKGQYFPSYLLCPETYGWYPVEKCSPILDQKTFSRFADESTVDENAEIDLDELLILYQRQLMSFTIYKKLCRGVNDDEEEVREYGQLVGKKLSQSLLLYRK